MHNSKPVLLVEGDDVDMVAVQRAFKDLMITNQLVNTANGEEALGYLKDEDNKKPCLILLDLNMPVMNGFEFLEIVKTDEALKEIPVVVLTTSMAEQDIAKSSELGVAGYMVKSVDYKEFVEIIRTIDMYLTSSELS
jgi:CheY-like chemotaxis protein